MRGSGHIVHQLTLSRLPSLGKNAPEVGQLQNQRFLAEWPHKSILRCVHHSIWRVYSSKVLESLSASSVRPFDTARGIWQRRVIVLLVLVVAVASVIGLDFVRTKYYASSATLQLLSQNFSTTGGTPSELSAQAIATQTKLISSAPVKARVARILHKLPPAASVSQQGVTALVAISVTSTDPLFAAKAANAYALAYIEQTRKQFLANQEAASTLIQLQINGLQLQIAEIQSKLAIAPKSEIAGLTSQLGTVTAQQQALRTQFIQLQINAAQAPSGGQIAVPAIPIRSPTSPKFIPDAIIAALLGLLLGCVVAYLGMLLDDRIKSQNDLEVVAEGLPTLGIIPRLPGWKNRKNAVLVAANQPKSPPAEAYRGLRTSIQFAGMDRSIKILEVTSPSVGDGKTTTAANLAVSIAETGRSVVIVGCDLRKPRIHEFFGVGNDIGLTTVLVHDATLEMACVESFDVPGLWVMPSGPVPSNPSELLGSKKGRETFKALAERFDFVILDCPPILPVTDAAIVATIAEAVLVVCSSGNSRKRDFARALQLLGRVNAPVLGTVLNTATEEDAYGYYRSGYGYGYGYGAPEPKSEGVKKFFSR